MAAKTDKKKNDEAKDHNWKKMLGHIPGRLESLIASYDSYDVEEMDVAELIDPRTQITEIEASIKYAQGELEKAKKANNGVQVRFALSSLKALRGDLKRAEGHKTKIENDLKKKMDKKDKDNYNPNITKFEDMLVPTAVRDIPAYLMEHQEALQDVLDTITEQMAECDTPYHWKRKSD